MGADFSGVMAHSIALIEKAEAVLRSKLGQHPHDSEMLFQLAQILRQKGDLTEAVRCYQRVLALNSGHAQARYLADMLTARPPSNAFPERVRPVPFVCIEDFLTPDQQALVWKQVEQNRQAFAPTKIQGGEVRTSARKSHAIYENELRDIAPWFLEQVRAELDRRWECLGVDVFEIGREEMQLTTHHHGGFFNAHTDSSDYDVLRDRKVTFVYYFHREPKRFEGGDLLLFDTDVEADECSVQHTRVVSKNNSLLLFPSCFYHLVTPLVCASERFEDGRFTINGWFHEKTQSEDV